MSTQALNIAMVNTALTQGGAAKAANRLCSAYNDHDAVNEATLFHAQSDQRYTHSVGLRARGAWQINAAMSRVGGVQLVQDFGFSRSVHKQTGHCDVMHIHNVHGYYMDYKKLLAPWVNRPVIWTWHDMWGATGRCAFSFECTGWESGCLSCPHKEYYPAAWIDRAASEYDDKFAVFSSLQNLQIVCPSRWLAQKAVQRGFDAARVHVIPYSLDMDRFRPANSDALRHKFDLPLNKTVVLFVAANCADPRKGYMHFAQSTEHEDCLALAVGLDPKEPASHVRHLGAMNDEAALVEFYQLADVLMVPSLADNYPNTVLESLACGTPAVGYAVGGVGEILEAPGCESVTTGDIAKLTEALKRFLKLDGATRGALQVPLLAHAQSLWSSKAVADQYLSLIHQGVGWSREDGHS